MNFVVRIGAPADLEAILMLFTQTIENSCSNDYTPDQIKVWTDSKFDRIKWLKKIQNQYFIVAEANQRIIGFASLEHDYLDFMYVHHEFMRKGIASQLLKALENEAQKNKVLLIKSDVSITAKSFFERNGFVEIKKNTLIRKGVEIVNFAMQKKLTSI